MRVSIEASQLELDRKRPELIKALAGSKFKVKISPIDEKTPEEGREPFYQAQKQMLEKYDEMFKKLLEDIKKDVDGILK